MRPPHRALIPAVLAIASATALVAGLVAPAASGAEPSSLNTDPLSTAPVGETRAVTLLTGDRVEVTDAGDGRYAATVVPGPGRERVTFQTLQVDGMLKVLPSDAVPFVASGLVDERLFEVSTLLEDGYADLDALPLIVSWSPGTRAASMEVAGAEQVRALPSIDGAALSADADELGAVWDALTPGAAVAEMPGHSAEQRMAGGIQRVWLDGRASASLDRSVPQIGAPAAWDAGYRGTGVTVAVLDTGVDAEHPDLTGQLDEIVDFTGSESGTADRVGHGTHVAATIAGTGAGADGARPGVAPEADLIIGKVLDDSGSGYDSWIIAGMEWAAENADIVNMSLGGGPTDGTDPLSLALDALSAQTDALFVVAAGNDGLDGAVSTPSTANSALSVAAVDREDSLAEFSSRGPRTIDSALKPEISAPGVGIVAARAAGTSMGSPVDALYTAANGTSMATPHVAGAAALLAQQNPDWSGQRLKDALISTANPNPELGVYAQGGGRVDVARAVGQPVTATGIADFALVTDDEGEAQERTVTFPNGRDIQHGVMSFSRTMPWVTPTDPVREGDFEFTSRWQLVRPSAIVTVPGTGLQPETALLGNSAVLTKPLRAELVAPGADLAGVRGKVAVVDAPDQGLEDGQIQAAADAGAKAVILVRPTTNSIFTVFAPGMEATPIPVVVTTAEDGAALISHAQGPGKQQITVEASRISPYLYDVIHVSPDEIPDVVEHTVTAENSHRVTTTYVESGGLPFAREQRFGWRPWMEYAWNDEQRTVATGEVREEWVSAGDSLWQHRVLHTWQNWFGRVSGGMTGPVRSYDVGRSAERWFDPVVRPGAVAGAPSTRTGDRLTLRVADLLDAEGHATVGDVTSAARVYRDGELLAELPNARQGVDVPAGEGTYRLELDVSRDDAEWQRAIRSSTAWTFPSARPAAGTTAELPLLQIAYDAPTDDDGHATKRPHRLGLQVTDQGGKVRSGATLTAEVSFDDGATWKNLPVKKDEHGFSAQVPAGTAPVTLRVTATDGSASVTQEVVRAYARR